MKHPKQKPIKNTFWNMKPNKATPFLNIKPKSKSFSPVSPVRLKQYPARTRSELNVIDKKPWVDSDKDKVPNIFDCKPLNKKKQSYMLRQDIRRRLRLPLSRKAHIKQIIKMQAGTSFKKNPEKKFVTQEEIVKFFEKHPDLIEKAEKVRGRVIEWKSVGSNRGEDVLAYFSAPKHIAHTKKDGWVSPPGVRYKGDRGRMPSSRPVIAINPYTEKEDNIREAIIHELRHRDQYADKKEWDRLEEEDRKFIKAHTTLTPLTGEGYGPGATKITTEYIPEDLPVEQDVIERMRELPEREIVHEESPEILQSLDEREDNGGESNYEGTDDEAP